MRLDIDHLSYYYYAKKPILRDINLTLEGTKPIAVIGQNGAGKTTLVKHFNRILTPTEGEVRIDGKSTSALQIVDLPEPFSPTMQKKLPFFTLNVKCDTELDSA